MKDIRNSNYAELLYKSDSIDKKFSILEDFILDAGFDGVFYSFFPKLSSLSNTLQPAFQFSNCYAAFIKEYQDNNYIQHDFIMRLIEEGNHEIIDWWKEEELTKLSDNEKLLCNTIKNKYKVTKGLTFPTLNNNHGFAGASIVSFKSTYKDIKIENEVLKQLKDSVQIYHDHMMMHQDDRYKFILPLLKSLTVKKKIVIKHLISGQPMKKIEEHGVTERYGEKLLLEIRKSFGDISKNELIYLLGLLNISEYL